MPRRLSAIQRSVRTVRNNLKRPSVGSRATGTAQSPRKAVRRSTARPVARRAARRVAAGRKR